MYKRQAFAMLGPDVQSPPSYSAVMVVPHAGSFFIASLISSSDIFVISVTSFSVEASCFLESLVSSFFSDELDEPPHATSDTRCV